MEGNTRTDAVPVRPDEGSVPVSPAMASFHSLPWELLMQIIRDLDYGSVLALSTLNNSFHSSIHPDHLVTKEERDRFLLRAEHFRQHKLDLACFSCMRILPREEFGDGMRSGKRGKHGCVMGKRATRFCWTCAAEKRLYGHSRPVLKGKLLYRLCHRCGNFNLESQRCTEDWCTGPSIKVKSKLEMLPRDIQQRIFGILDYRDAIMLSMTTKFFHETVNPQECDIRSKFLFMKHAQRQTKRASSKFYCAMGCYGCFSYKPRSKFSRKQLYTDGGTGARLDRTLTFTRRCHTCLYRFYGPVESARATADRSRFHRQVMCGGCNEMRYADQEESCSGCVALAVKMENLQRIGVETRTERRLRREKLLAEIGIIGETFDLGLWLEKASSKDGGQSDLANAPVSEQEAERGLTDHSKARYLRGEMSTAERSLFEGVFGRARNQRYPIPPISSGNESIVNPFGRGWRVLLSSRISKVFLWRSAAT